jgi:hypothetical protein
MSSMSAARHCARVRAIALIAAVALPAAACGGPSMPGASAPARPSAPKPVVDAPAPARTTAPKRVVDAPAASARDMVSRLAVKGRAPKTGYRRDRFGDGWATLDGCDTRDRILVRDLRAKVFRDPSGRCVVLSGRLVDPYTATTVEYDRGGGAGVDVDHVVALGDAWQKGAQRWPQRERVALANDPLNLLAVDASANRQKGDGDAATWLPANKAFRCRYVARQVAVKLKYALWVTAAERDAMLRVLARCPAERLPAQVPTPTAAAPARMFASCAAARAAGAAPLRRGSALYSANRHLDRDGDGIACE